MSKLGDELKRRISHNRKVTVQQLLLQLENTDINTSARNIQRWLKNNSEKFGIECDDRSKPYGYKLKPDAKGFSLQTLSEHESLLLLLAEQHLRNLVPASLMKSMDSFFKQAQRNIGPDTDKKRAREWLTKVRVVSTTQPLLPAKINPAIFEEVSKALYNNYWLDLEYKNSEGKITNSDIMPLGLAQQGERMYLVCRFRGYKDERNIVLHRIISARASAFSFDRPKEFNLQKYDADGRFGFGEGKRIQLSFRIDKEAGLHLLESPLSVDQTVKETEDYYQITATVVKTAQLEWWLRGFGEEISNIRRKAI